MKKIIASLSLIVLFQGVVLASSIDTSKWFITPSPGPYYPGPVRVDVYVH